MNSFVDLIVQPDDITCGPTSVAMILRFHGIDAKVEDIKKITKTVWYTSNGRDFGMTAPSLVRDSFSSYGLSAVLKKGDIRHLKKVVSSGVPVITLMRSGEWNWHYVVVTGYGNGYIYFANPSNGEIEGLGEKEFYSSWNWKSDIRGKDRSWWIAFWLNSLEIYPCSYVYVVVNI